MFAQARYYLPEIGRFISEDSYKGTLPDTQSQNRYIYCTNNPLKYIDPSGHEGEEDWPDFDMTKRGMKILNPVAGIINIFVPNKTNNEYFELIREESPTSGIVWAGAVIADASRINNLAKIGMLAEEVEDIKNLKSTVKTSDDIFIEELQKAKKKEKGPSPKGKREEEVKARDNEILEEYANEINIKNNKGKTHLEEVSSNTKTKDKIKSKIIAAYAYTKEEAAIKAKGEAFKRADEIRSGKLQKPIIYNEKGLPAGGGGKYTPTTTGVGVSTKTGKVYAGDSGMKNNLTRSELTDVRLEKMLETEKTKLLKQNGKEYFDANNNGIVSYNGHKLENCAEFNIANQALKNGENLSDIVVYTVDVKTGVYKAPCLNCQNLYKGMNFIK